MTDRLQKLLSMYDKTPKDTFVIYGVAMEYKKAKDISLALEWFDKVIATDAGYSVAYHQAALTLEMDEKISDAIAMYNRGIIAAEKKGDIHAADEMRAAMAVIE